MKDYFGDIFDRGIGSIEEAKIYKDANLKSGTTGGRPSLRRTDIDFDQREPWGLHRTNKERMELGYAPLDKNNRSIELHHIGQDPKGPLAELTYDEHKGNSGILHTHNKEGSRFIGENDRKRFEKEKKEYWKNRESFNNFSNISSNDFNYKSASDSSIADGIGALADGIVSVLTGITDFLTIFSKKWNFGG